MIEERRLGIGSTDSAAILGVSPWKDAHTVWREKVHGDEPKEPSLPMWLGTKLETAIGELYVKQTGEEIIHVPEKQFVLEPRGILRCHIDFAIMPRGQGEAPGHLECKTARSKRGWGLGPPRHYWIQAQHQMAVLGHQWVDIAALFGHDDFQVYTVQRDNNFIDSLITDMEEWWDLYVVTRTPPPIDGSEGSARWLREAYPRSVLDSIPATAEHEALVSELYTLRDAQAALARSDEVIVQSLKDSIGDHEGLVGSGFRIRWKSNKDYQKIDWEQVANIYRDSLISVGVPNAQLERAIIENTEIKQGKRPFVVEWDERLDEQ